MSQTFNLLERFSTKNRIAFKVLKKAKKEKSTFVDLGNCGIDRYLPEELFDEYFVENLEGLSLGYCYKLESNDKYKKTQNIGKQNIFYGDYLTSLSRFRSLSKLIIAYDYDFPGSLKSMDFVKGCLQLKELDFSNN